MITVGKCYPRKRYTFNYQSYEQGDAIHIIFIHFLLLCNKLPQTQLPKTRSNNSDSVLLVRSWGGCVCAPCSGVPRPESRGQLVTALIWTLGGRIHFHVDSQLGQNSIPYSCKTEEEQKRKKSPNLSIRRHNKLIVAKYTTQNMPHWHPEYF